MYLNFEGTRILYQAIESVRYESDGERFRLIVRTVSGREHQRMLDEGATMQDAESAAKSLLDRMVIADVLR